MITLITGGSRGIGFAIAEEMAAKGSDLLLVAKQKGTLESAAGRLLKKHQIKVHTHHCNLSDERNVEKLFEFCVKNALIPDLLVLNAGIFREGSLTKSKPEDYRATMEVNLNSIYYLVRLLTPRMTKRPKPRIVIIASTAAYEAYPVGALYGVAKWALRGYAINLRKELMNCGIGVTLLSPGGTLTDLWAGEDLPKDRLLTPNDIGKLVAALTELSAQAVVEEIIIRPMLGDMHE